MVLSGTRLFQTGEISTNREEHIRDSLELPNDVPRSESHAAEFIEDGIAQTEEILKDIFPSETNRKTMPTDSVV